MDSPEKPFGNALQKSVLQTIESLLSLRKFLLAVVEHGSSLIGTNQKFIGEDRHQIRV